MKIFEKAPIWLRHLPVLENADWLWNAVRPLYQRAIGVLGRNGLERIINGSDCLVVSPRVRGAAEKYEPEVWRALMDELRAGDTFVDVGAFIGLYSVAVGLRLQGSGQVIAFEPDRRNFSLLREHVQLNGLERDIELHNTAAFDKNGRFHFLADGSSEARLISPNHDGATVIDCVTLDDALVSKRVDILKIDVEGYEETVLRGATSLLRTSERRPRAIFIEVHPYAWPSLKTTSASLLGLLNETGYQVQTVGGITVDSIEGYGEIVARPAT